MYVDVITGTIVLVMFIMVIFWQILLLMSQRTKQMEMDRDYNNFKSSIETTWKAEIDNILKQNRDLIHTINKLIEHKTNNEN